MSIRTEDRERIRRQATIVRRWINRDHPYAFECDRCSFQRDYATESGAVNGAAEHLAVVHRARLTLEHSQRVNVRVPGGCR